MQQFSTCKTRNNCKADPICSLIITKWMNLPKLCVTKNLLCFNSHFQQLRVISLSQSTCVVCFFCLQMTFGGPSVLFPISKLVSFVCSNMERKNSNYLSPAHTAHSVMGTELGLGLISHSLLSELSVSIAWIWLIPFMTPLTSNSSRQVLLACSCNSPELVKLQFPCPFIWGND